MSDNDVTQLDPREFCRIDLGENGGTHLFYGREAVINWLDEEITAWKWVQGNNRSSVSPYDLLSRLRRSLSEQLSDDELFKADFVRTVTEIFGPRHGRVHSASRFGRFLLNLNDASSDEANWALATRNDQYEMPRNQSWVEYRSMILGAARALVFELGISPVTDGVATNNLLQSSQEAITHQSQELSALHGKVHRLADDFEKLIEQSNVQRESDHNSWETQAERHNAAMAVIEKEWAERIKMRAAVEYWSKRKFWQGLWSVLWALSALLLMAGAISWLSLGSDRVGHIPNEVQTVLDDVRNKKIEGAIATVVLTQSFIRSAAPIVLPAMLFIWVLRILVRNYVSASHLMTDAAEREILIQTYLALSTDKDLANLPEIRDKALPQMLQSVFRHTADGLVKDDGLPAQAIVDLAKGGSR